MLELIVDKSQNLKEFTDNAYAQASFYYNTLLKNKEIKVNGKRVNRDVLLFEGDVVAYYLTKKQEEKPAFYTVYEDENVLVVDKEDGVNSEAVFAALFLAFSGAGIFALVLLARRRAQLQSAIALGPWLIVGGFGMYMFMCLGI